MGTDLSSCIKPREKDKSPKKQDRSVKTKIHMK